MAGASIDAGAADHLAPVYAQFPTRRRRRLGRAPAHARRPTRARSLRRSRGRRAGLRAPALARGARRAGACAALPEQRRAARRAGASRHAAGAVRGAPARHGVLLQHGRRGERERAQARAAHHGPAQGRRGRRQLSRPHRRGGRRDLGRRLRSGMAFRRHRSTSSSCRAATHRRSRAPSARTSRP